MNEITARLIQSFMTIGYAFLFVSALILVMKFFGKHLVKTANVCIVSSPIIGIFGGWIEWLITGNNKLTLTNFAEWLFITSLILYTISFFAYIFFNWEDKEDVAKI